MLDTLGHDVIPRSERRDRIGDALHHRGALLSDWDCMAEALSPGGSGDERDFAVEPTYETSILG